MAHFPLVFRLLLASAGSLLVFAPPLAPRAAAQDDWDDGWGDEEEEDGGGWGDEGDGGDGGGGWGDGGGGGGWGEEEEEDTEQPPVTAGGLYTKRTYPVAELQRPLTLIEGMFEGRVGIDVDLSNETAFDNWRGVLEARYGLKDFWELRLAANFLMAGEADPLSGTNQARFVVGVERSIVFDLVDFRAQAEIPINPDADMADSAAFDLAFGFPFRYRYKDKIGLIALEKLMTIHTDGRDPDLTPAVGVIAQLAPPFAVLAEAEVIVPQFNFDQDELIRVPVTAAAQFSPNNRVDLGLEFTFANVKPPGEAGPLDARTLLLYVQPRF